MTDDKLILTKEELEDIKKVAWDDGYESGYDNGYADGIEAKE